MLHSQPCSITTRSRKALKFSGFEKILTVSISLVFYVLLLVHTCTTIYFIYTNVLLWPFAYIRLPSYAVKIGCLERLQYQYHKRIASLLNSKAANQVLSGKLNGPTKHSCSSRSYKTAKIKVGGPNEIPNIVSLRLLFSFWLMQVFFDFLLQMSTDLQLLELQAGFFLSKCPYFSL